MIKLLTPLLLAVGISSCCCPYTQCDAEAYPEPQQSEATLSIAATAAQAGQFATLATALQAADLVTTLDEGGPFTVFAPTDAAFGELPEGTLDSLLADTKALSSVLTYHVVSGEVLSSSLSDGDRVTTLNGAELEVRVDGGAVYIGGARVSAADIRCSNGVVHQIDGVLVP